MSVGDIVGLIFAGAFLILVILLGVPLVKLGRVFDQVRESIEESTDELTPTLAESQVTIREANRQLAKVDAITTNVSEVTDNVNSLVALTAATIGGPLIKIAGFSAAARAGFQSLRGRPSSTGRRAKR